MTTQVFFVLGKAENALMVPAEVLTRRSPRDDNEKGKAYRIAVAGKEGSEQRLIHVGLQTRTQAEVTNGLKEGEQILVNRPSGAGNRNGAGQQPQANNRPNAQRFNRGPQL
jgi:macrolide-specific efflux system membrane fusion protein